MSDIPADWRGQLDLRKELARIDRDRAETQKLMKESEKFVAEASKLNRDRWLAPFVMASSLIASIGGGLIVAVLSHLWR